MGDRYRAWQKNKEVRLTLRGYHAARFGRRRQCALEKLVYQGQEHTGQKRGRMTLIQANEIIARAVGKDYVRALVEDMRFLVFYRHRPLRAGTNPQIWLGDNSERHGLGYIQR